MPKARVVNRMAYHFNFSLFDRQGQRKYLNQQERKRFYHATQAQKREDIRLFCLLLLFTGARISEIANLNSTSVDFANKSLTVQTLKRRRTGIFRQIPLPDPLLHDLEKYLERLTKKTVGAKKLWCFSVRTASRWVKIVMTAADINGTKASALGLRHGFAVQAAAKVPITQVQKWLGHARLQTTAIYANACGAEERELAKKLWTL